MQDSLLVKRITLHRVNIPLQFTFKTARGTVQNRETIIIEMENEDGQKGYGECVAFADPFYTDETVDLAWHRLVHHYGPAMLSAQIERAKEIHDIADFVHAALGMMASERAGSESEYQHIHSPMAVAGLENALLNLECTVKGQNTVEYVMGESLQDTIPCGVAIGDIPMDTLIDVVRTHVEQGCQRIKLKIKPEDGYERTKLVRAAFPNITLAVDANRSYSFAQIDDVALLNDFNLACIEEPFDVSSVQTLALLKQEALSKGLWSITMPICLDESILTFEDLEYAVRHDLIDVLNIKIGRLGGLYPVKRIIDYCRDNDIKFWIGSMVETGVSKMLHVQLAALADTYMAGDLSDSKRYFEDDLIMPDITFTDGQMTVPKGPGLGVEVRPDVLSRYAVETVVIETL